MRISQDDDFINHAEADLSVVAEFKENGYPVPTLEDIHFDMTGDTILVLYGTQNYLSY